MAAGGSGGGVAVHRADARAAGVLSVAGGDFLAARPEGPDAPSLRLRGGAGLMREVVVYGEGEGRPLGFCPVFEIEVNGVSRQIVDSRDLYRVRGDRHPASPLD